MKQNDVVVSPPAFVWDPYFILTHVTFSSIFSCEFLSSDRQTDRQTDRWEAMHKSPPCISTGGLKNYIFKRALFGPK